ncbi:MAG TPA: anti-sigma regulatory factor [Terriglobales bacterium]|nr:anti-sigma regulatory factor [Terriglobales bacterium]
MIPKTETLPIQSASDVVKARQAVRSWASEMRFSLVDQTKIVTAASELARNTLQHGGGGSMIMSIEENGIRQGLRLTFEDKGPGIPDVEVAMRDGYTTAGGMGLGLSGSKRLMNQFEIETKVGEGTRVTVIRWK